MRSTICANSVLTDNDNFALVCHRQLPACQLSQQIGINSIALDQRNIMLKAHPLLLHPGDFFMKHALFMLMDGAAYQSLISMHQVKRQIKQEHSN